MDWGSLAAWANVSVSLTALGISVVAARMARSDAKLSSINLQLLAIEKRTAAVEQELKHVPSAEGFHELSLSLTAMKGQIDVLVERVQPIRAMSERMQEALIELRK